MEYPADGNYIQAVKDSCKNLTDLSGIKVEKSTIERLLRSPAFVESYQRLSKAHGLLLAFPLQFPSVASEFNFLSIIALLNFGSGYRIPLHEQTNRGAWDNIRALCFSLYITSSSGTDYLSAQGMKSITEQLVAEHMRVSLHLERPHESIPGVTVGELGGPVHQLVKLITQTLNETGEVLHNSGYPDLGSFVYESVEAARNVSRDGPPDLNVVLDKPVHAIPGFRDMTTIDGQPVYLFKKALFLVYSIVVRFGDKLKTPTSKLDASTLPVFSDNVLPSMLVHLGILDLSVVPALSNIFPNRSQSNLESLLERAPLKSEVVAALPKEPPRDGPTLTTEQAYILRAAAVYACEVILSTAHELSAGTDSDGNSLEWMKDMRGVDMDLWLWAVAKDRPDYRSLVRFVLRDTVMF